MMTWFRFALAFGMTTGFLSIASLHAQAPGGWTNIGTETDANYIWNGQVNYFWEFSSVSGSNYDVWNISSLDSTSGSPSLVIYVNDFGTTGFNGDTGDSDQGHGYWFENIITVGSGDGNLSDVSISGFAGEPGHGKWHVYYGDESLSLYYYAGGNNNPGFSVVPEPSTYFMVSGLLALPAWRACRRFRRKRTDADNSAEAETV